MTYDDAFELVTDICGVVCIAVPAGFVAYVWSQGGTGPAGLMFGVVFSAYMAGRWRAGKVFARDLERIRKGQGEQ